jgi:hypothetical protein
MSSIFKLCDRERTRKSSKGGYGTTRFLRLSWSQMQHKMQQAHCTALIDRVVAKSVLGFVQLPFQAIP